MTPFARSSIGPVPSGSWRQREHEEERLQSDVEVLRDEFGDLFEEAPIAYVQEGLDSRFIRANRAARTLLGIGAEEVTSTYGRSLIADTTESRRRLLDAFESVRQGEERIGVILELRRKDSGQAVWVEWSSRPALSGLYTRTVLVDITRRVLIEHTGAALELSLESGHVNITARKHDEEALLSLFAQAREAAIVAERNRMAREIHDTLAQGFTGVIVQLEAAADASSKSLPAEARTHIERAKDLARDSLRDARRSVRALRPQELERNELSEAIEALIRKTTAGTSVSSEFVLSGQPRRLPPVWDENLIRIVQEVLTNVLRHSRATRFTASIEFDGREVRLRLADNGQGFDSSIEHEGFGLVGIGERVAEMGGSLVIDSRPAAGVKLMIVLARDEDASGDGR